MKSSLRPALARSFAATACGLALALAATAAPRSSVASVFPFDLDRGIRYFDGVELSTVVLASPKITLMTDTLGAWIPLDRPTGSAGFTMRHRSLPGVVINVSVLDAAAESEEATSWKDYVGMIQQQLGESIAIASESDSAADHHVVRLLDGRTRQVRFNANTREPYSEFHTITTKGRTSVAFILSGPAESVDRALDDFQFVLSRLERVSK